MATDEFKKHMKLRDEWNIIIQIACDITNYTIANDNIAARGKRKEILEELVRLRSIYGEIPYIIEITAVYTRNTNKKLSLFELAYSLSSSTSEYDESLAIATSAFEFCLEDKLKNQSEIWRARVNGLLSKATDSELLHEANILLNEEYQ